MRTSSLLAFRSWSATIVAGLAAAAALADSPPAARAASPWWAHVQRLASDEYQGRLTGSEGYAKAAAYVADRFQSYGLTPAGDRGYFQSVGYITQVVHPERSKVTLLRGTQPIELDVGDDLVLSTNTLQPPLTQGPLVFAGYGIHMPEAGYDDFRDLSIKGAIVVILIGGPAGLTAAQRAYGLAETLPRALEQGGAAGLVALLNPKAQEIPWSRVRAASTQPGMLLEEPELQRFKKPLLAISFNPLVAESLFVASGHSFAELVKLADVHKALPHFALNASLEAHVAASSARVTADNIVAELPGSDTQLAPEAVVVSAHLDHLGSGPRTGATACTAARWTTPRESPRSWRSRGCCTSAASGRAARCCFCRSRARRRACWDRDTSPRIPRATPARSSRTSTWTASCRSTR